MSIYRVTGVHHWWLGDWCTPLVVAFERGHVGVVTELEKVGA
jgi:hypothetical protein